MALISAFSDSEAAGNTSNQGKDSEGEGSGAASCGYTQVTSTRDPATTNAEVTTTKNFGTEISGGQHGTSIGAYAAQKETYSAESGE